MAVLELTAPPPPDPILDLSSCDREPIHIPGSIQPHGFLLAFGPDKVVSAASGTVADYLHIPLDRTLGAPLTDLLAPDIHEQITRELAVTPLTAATRILTTLQLQDGSAPFDVVAYPTKDGQTDQPITVLEFEQTREPVDIPALNVRLYNFVGNIRRQRELHEICQCAVDEIQSLTQCGRVVLYSFDEQGHGHVLSERLTAPEFTSYLGLRFPASDVPAQARRLYEINRVRIIPDVNYEPSPLFGLAESVKEMDLSPSVLRSVSPIHRAYMRNMGTACSMSVSIIIDGKLWGLVSCHHPTPRFLPLRMRSACDFIIQIATAQIESHTNAVRLQRALRAKGIHGRLLASMAAQDDYMQGLAQAPALLQELVNADGVAIVMGVGAQLFGYTPSEPQVVALVDHLRDHKQDEFFTTDRLGESYPRGEGFAGQASGVIAVSVSRFHSTHLLWFRRELVQTVRWAGDPQKPAASTQESPTPGIVSPRHSFQEWQQTVRGASRPWTPEEIAAAHDFRGAVLEIVLSRAEDLADLAAGLQVANEELEAFSYSVSHDLRAPFRHISGFSEMLKDTEGERLSDRGRHYLDTILESARFAGLLVDSLLQFSRFARSKVVRVPVNMEALADSEWHSVVEDEAGRPIAFTRGPLPRVMGDEQLLRQVLRNLFSNAVKYTGKKERPTVEMHARTEGQEFIFSIQDNGAGFDEQYAGKLFGVFQRLHRAEEFEGTGIGLANVRRIIGRHGGRTWANGEVGKGATFFFSMPAVFPSEGA